MCSKIFCKRKNCLTLKRRNNGKWKEKKGSEVEREMLDDTIIVES